MTDWWYLSLHYQWVLLKKKKKKLKAGSCSVQVCDSDSRWCTDSPGLDLKHKLNVHVKVSIVITLHTVYCQCLCVLECVHASPPVLTTSSSNPVQLLCLTSFVQQKKKLLPAKDVCVRVCARMCLHARMSIIVKMNKFYTMWGHFVQSRVPTVA